ncbi:MAG: tail fiber protein [Cytophagales bacterium]|nr:tail fiber protein [Cytophagales bacterium]
MNGVIGEIRLFGGNFAPRNWAFCEGQLLSISSNQALFSIIGTTYGGDGRTTMGLPDLRGRSAIHPGTGPGLSTRILGQRSGTETVVLSVNQMPPHVHAVQTENLKFITFVEGFNETGTVSDPAGNMPAATTSGYMYGDDESDKKMAEDLFALEETIPFETSKNGGQQPFNNMQPVLGLYYIICLTGVFPSRS